MGVQGKEGGFAPGSSSCSSQQSGQFIPLFPENSVHTGDNEGSQGCLCCPLPLQVCLGSWHTLFPCPHTTLWMAVPLKVTHLPWHLHLPSPSAAPKLLLLLHQLLVTSPAALLICLLHDAVKDSLSSEYWNSYCQELLCWQNSLSQGTAFPSGRTPRVSRSLLLQGQPALPILGGVVRLTALALHAQEVELHRGAGIAVVAKDLHREGRERLQHQRGAHRNRNDEHPEPTRDLSSSLPTPWPDF